LLRVSVALGFERGRLKSVYQVLRGKDLETGVFSLDRRDAQFLILQETQAKVLDLTNWHQFLSALIGAGFRSGEMISSQSAPVRVCVLSNRTHPLQSAGASASEDHRAMVFLR
jgi:hypothetical protein